ncbi:di-heme oxidoredictase family protein [Pacificoceanicola onchidii]|uniref:di-heme oxidoreductase family protein n=1 Tax=Pacificoceanicola onchidii TaxID=2562685 RepID=UPI0010A5166E|nr:di-heme oxidoredictase family protein [Pacificoceanicola onchidii]
MRAPRLFALPLSAAIAFSAQPLPAQGLALWEDLRDHHLSYTPRTAQERDRVRAVTALPTDFEGPWAFEKNAGGAQTVRARRTPDAFSQPAHNLTFEQELDFRVGNGLFKRLWVSPPASTIASDGLGPLFNARSCQRCHIKDGRGHPPEGPDDLPISMFLRVSIPAPDTAEIAHFIDGTHPTVPEPTYGLQLQDFSLPGHKSEAQMTITYEEITVPLSGGQTASLRKPTYAATDLGYGPMHPEAMLSPRVAPQMIGMGLLEAIPSADILEWADPEDADGNGISGKPQIVWSEAFDAPMLGRFGHKAGNASLIEQNADAFSGDIGISNPLKPALAGECTKAQASCQNALHGGDPEQSGFEVDQIGLDLVTFYSRTLGVPARRGVDDPEVLRGRRIFYDSGCADCHRPTFVTHRLEGDDPASFQLIWPYSDMLLHDMGPGLADNRPEGRADGQEWRTAPLWGIGLTKQVSGHSDFLHDGRARSLLEAILWHGGEAETARSMVVDMPVPDRVALIRFLESL